MAAEPPLPSVRAAIDAGEIRQPEPARPALAGGLAGQILR